MVQHDSLYGTLIAYLAAQEVSPTVTKCLWSDCLTPMTGCETLFCCRHLWEHPVCN